MRIIGGIYKSRLIAMPKGVENLRPTQDKVREAVFNILGDISGSNVLDLFAGTGAFGIESLSRGARYVTFVDNNFRCAEAIRFNLESLDVDNNKYEIIRANGLSVFPRLEKREEKFNLIFSDPPYHKGVARKCLINIDSYDILAQSGLAIIEYFKKDNLKIGLKDLVLEKERRYGDTFISIYRKRRQQHEESNIPGNV